MEIKNILKSAGYFLVFGIILFGILFLANYKIPEKETVAAIVEPALELPEPEPVFNAEVLDWEQVSNQIPWEERDSHAVVIYKDKLWLMGGLNANGLVVKPGLVQYDKAKYFSDVWSSEDGITWTKIANS